MKVSLKDDIIYINCEDLPHYKKGGSVVRNSYFWALKSISCYSARGRDWEYDRDVWVALSRILLSFSQSGYLSDRETLLEFADSAEIPESLRSVSTWL
ncbi:MAG: hypothetical protein AB4038_14460 [Prochloraceae cyanobacterium]